MKQTELMLKKNIIILRPNAWGKTKCLVDNDVYNMIDPAFDWFRITNQMLQERK